MLRRTLFFLLISLSMLAAVGVAAGKGFDYDEALRISQDAIDNRVKNQVFTKADGKPVELSNFRGKPLVISMIFTSCYQVCPMTTRHLAKIVEKARDALGTESFSVAVIGFDSAFDNPVAMQNFAVKQGVDDKGWNLLSIPQKDTESFSKQIGFVFYPSSNGFDHIVQATILDADGKVYRQVYGQVFETPLLVDPLIELVLGRPEPAQTFLSNLTKKVKLFCTTYDPVRDGYFLDYSLFLGMIIGGTIILLTGIFIFKERAKSRNLPGV